MVYGIEYLRNKLESKRKRVLERYKYYEMKNCVKDLGISTPPQLRWYQSTLGWCAKSVDALADRLQFRDFKDDNFNLSEIFKLNNPDVFFNSAVLSALIASCCFVYISADETGFPRLQVIDGSNATGIIDPITGMLLEGYAVLSRDEYGVPIKEAYFLPGITEFYSTESDEENFSITHGSTFPALVPIIYRPDARREFGHSRISRSCMSIQDEAVRAIKRSAIAAEFYSFPQKYVVGLSNDAEPMDKWKATMASMLEFTKDEDGDRPTVGQFSQQSMGPHIEQLKMYASLFGGETGLTLDDLGFATGNPSSADAIKAAHENLRLTAKKAQGTFGTGLLNVGIVAASIRDNYAYERKAFYKTTCSWYPVFSSDGAAMSGIGDAIIKINNAYHGYFTEEKIAELIGV